MQPTPIVRAINAAGSQTALANRLGISQASVAEWKARNRIPAARVLAVEALTGVSRHQLRPDLYPDYGRKRGRKGAAATYGAGARTRARSF